MFTRFFCRVAFLTLSLFIALSIFATSPVFAAPADGVLGEKVTLVFDNALPNVPGKSMKVQMVEYEPGVSSIPHTHAASAFIYATVLEGAIRSKVNDDPEQVYHAGENFTELPGDHHRVSANASDTEPARLLAVLIVDTDEQNLVINDEE
ncbi:cupin domain-containing protein [Oculatella sp. FACHB-28]|uniref:cupin domain-containing protein n=1 Tax=Oculatella sp. FACHB-28 TaxID=2692845 RepID=UPI001683FC86|nr:cupin domain-containing protein [Oculatella sp. FACHB-28]MBD2059657.1 cupin domain-containing protein [Oculatella sp. FACHB-28]